MQRIGRLLLVVALSTLAVACGDGSDSSSSSNAICGVDNALETRRDSCEFASGAVPADTIGACTGTNIPIEHIVVIMQENRSFDHYFGHLPQYGQPDVDVAPAGTASPAADGSGSVPWYHETKYCVGDTDHGWRGSHKEWNNGANDGFPLANARDYDPTGSRAMGYYDQTDLPYYYGLASAFATSDRYFCSLLGPTYPNRMYLYAGTSFGIVRTTVAQLAPRNAPMLLRQLDEKGITWKAYNETAPTVFLFPDYAFSHSAQLVAASQFDIDAANGTLPQVSFVDASFSGDAAVETDEHPPANMQLGQRWVSQKVDALMHSPLWPKTALFITYDENGGLYDHVPPPAACLPDATAPTEGAEIGTFDRLGFRVPLIVVSPYARRHFVSHRTHSHTSILRFIQAKFELPALTGRDANSDAMLDLFDFDSPPDLSIPSLPEPPVDEDKLAQCRVDFP